MKAYNIRPVKILVAGEEMTVLNLGEDGRGRVLKRVPCPAQFEYLEPNPEPAGAMVKPRAKLLASSSGDGWIARISTEGGYIRGAAGNVSAPAEYAEQIRLVALGQGAFGDAGRTGTWHDYVLATSLEEFWLRVKPSRGAAYVLLFKDEKVSKLAYDQAELLDLDFMGSSPSHRGDLIRFDCPGRTANRVGDP
jgi:hypothetical protein